MEPEIDSKSSTSRTMTRMSLTYQLQGHLV